jgi:hypothetical protein
LGVLQLQPLVVGACYIENGLALQNFSRSYDNRSLTIMIRMLKFNKCNTACVQLELLPPVVLDSVPAAVKFGDVVQGKVSPSLWNS